VKIYSWNVNGLRAVERKGALGSFLAAEKPEILLLQEIKGARKKVPKNRGGELSLFGEGLAKEGGSTEGSAEGFAEENEIAGYVGFVTLAERAGYSGTGVYVRKDIYEREKPVRREMEFSQRKADEYGEVTKEGRVTVVEFRDFFVVAVYTPNSKEDLSRLELREKYWDPEFLEMMKELEAEKPVVFAGDFNAAHEEIDIARPEANHRHAGFTDEERRGVTKILGAGFIDSFREKHPTEVKYTWWSYRAGARARNVGWRIDYVFVSPKLWGRVRRAEILGEYMGSDHCPIMVEIEG